MKKFIAGLLAIAMLISGILPATMTVSAAQYITTTMSVEKFVLGQGYVVRPTRIQVKQGATAADVFEDVMAQEGKGYELSSYGYFIDAIEDADRGEIHVSDTLKEALQATESWDGTYLTLYPTDETPESLGSGDYCSWAGWNYSVNDQFPSEAMDGYTVENGDVIRLQFSLTGGSDVDRQYAWGTPVYPNMADRTELTRIYGYVHQQIAQDPDYLVKENLTECYEQGLTVIGDLESTTEQVTAAADAFHIEVVDAVTLKDDVKVHSVRKVTGSQITSARKKAIAAIKRSTKATYGNEWNIVALKRAKASGCTQLYKDYLKNLKSTLSKNKGALSKNAKPTDYARVCITLTALGKNPKKFEGYNLMEPLGNYNEVTKQGLNSVIYALIALDSGKYNMPTIANKKAQATRVKYMDYILSKQLKDGGFALTGTTADADVTAMALTALAPYEKKYKRAEKAIKEALTALSKLQQSNGSFYSGRDCTAESNAQVIIALTSLGIHPRTDERFLKNGRSAVAALLSFQTSGDGFAHLAGGKENALATTQAGLALIAYQLFVDHKKPLYQIK